MNLSIEIETGEDCLFKIKDITDEYLSEDSLEGKNNTFRYSDTISVVTMAKHSSSNKELEYLKPVFLKHENQNAQMVINTNFNAYFDVYYIVIPTETWVKNNQNLIANYTEVYYSDGKDIYKIYKGETSKVSAKDLSEVNTINTTISRVTDKLVSICFLKKYFINLCNQIYDKRVFSKCSFNGYEDKQLIYKRDLIWTIINLISLYTEARQYYEAQRIIELVEKCDDVFKLDNLTLNSNCKLCQ